MVDGPFTDESGISHVQGGGVSAYAVRNLGARLIEDAHGVMSEEWHLSLDWIYTPGPNGSLSSRKEEENKKKKHGEGPQRPS